MIEALKKAADYAAERKVSMRLVVSRFGVIVHGESGLYEKERMVAWDELESEGLAFNVLQMKIDTVEKELLEKRKR
jgi:hypothetical protein